MNINIFKKKLYIQIPEKYNQEFNTAIIRINAFRIKLLCLGFICLGSFLFVIDYKMFNTQGLSNLHHYYLWFDSILFGLGLLFYLALIGAQKYDREKLQFQQIIIFISSLILLSWCGAVSAVEYYTHNSVSTLIIGALILASGIYQRGWVLCLIYATSLTIFMLCKSNLSFAPLNFLTEHTNLIGLTVFGWLLSRILYINKAEIFLNQKNILKKNKQLANEIIIRKTAQNKLQKTQGVLEQRVLERTQELLMVNTELKNEIYEREKAQNKLNHTQKMEAIGTLAGGVAHDLNNVLSAQVGYPELLLMDLAEDSPLREPILRIQESGQKAAAIVQDLLTMARRGVVVTDVINLNQVIDSYIQSQECEKLKQFYPDIIVKSNINTDLLNIMGSTIHLFKTIMNLVNNAAEAMPQGGNIIISTQNLYIDKPINGYDTVNEGDYVVLSVSDTGTGIAPADIEQIFEPFYTKKVMGRSGTGLGMAVVWGTVKDHKGYIDVQSTENFGTTFTLYFPITRKEISEQQQNLPIEAYMGTGESILIVDDVKEQRKIASDMLSRLYYLVASVASGEQALDYMEKNSVDLVILDMIMEPGIDGCETYKQISKLHPEQKAIITSGFSETGRVKETQRLGAGEYIKKPYTLETIGLAVKRELKK
ncbi:MAG: response regulator [Desulfobacteraceae bacterium]|nr:response regulator [Desulfobacteraceae bacterium]